MRGRCFPCRTPRSARSHPRPKFSVLKEAHRKHLALIYELLGGGHERNVRESMSTVNRAVHQLHDTSHILSVVCVFFVTPTRHLCNFSTIRDLLVGASTDRV